MTRDVQMSRNLDLHVCKCTGIILIIQEQGGVFIILRNKMAREKKGKGFYLNKPK